MDWRLTNQEQYLQGIELERRTYKPASANNDHDHCEFCNAKFMVKSGADILLEGYTTQNRYYWICSECFNDFKERFAWTLSKPTTTAVAETDPLSIKLEHKTMEITKDTKVSAILQEYGDIADVMEIFGIKRVGRYSFRRMITKAITVENAARIHKVPLDEFMDTLHKATRAQEQKKDA